METVPSLVSLIVTDFFAVGGVGTFPRNALGIIINSPGAGDGNGEGPVDDELNEEDELDEDELDELDKLEDEEDAEGKRVSKSELILDAVVLEVVLLEVEAGAVVVVNEDAESTRAILLGCSAADSDGAEEDEEDEEDVSSWRPRFSPDFSPLPLHIPLRSTKFTGLQAPYT